MLGAIIWFNEWPSSENNYAGYCGSGKLFGGFFSIQALSG
jgi:hypothetical protein